MIKAHLILSQTRLIFSRLTDFSSVLTEFNSIWSDFWSDSDPNPTRSTTRVYKKLNPKISHSSQNRSRLGPVSHPGDFRRTLESFSVVFRRAISVLVPVTRASSSGASFYIRRELSSSVVRFCHSSGEQSLIIGSLQQIVRKDGFRGMYRGLSPTILALLPNWAVYFTVYDWLKGSLSSDDGSHQLSFGGNMIAASGAGVATVMFSVGEAARTGTPFREEVHGDGGLHIESVERGRSAWVLPRVCDQSAADNSCCRHHFHQL
ncbi:hypothetical protein LXL04_024897 [Taraxacum kok-saghyz]